MNVFYAICALIALTTQVSGDCNIAGSARKECGDVHSTETSCLASKCCWHITPGAVYCFHPTGTSTNTTTGPHVTKGPDVHPSGETKVYIHMMPWFETKASNNGQWGIHWSMANMHPDQMNGDKRRIASKFYPLIDLYASGDSHVIDWQLGLMKLSGVSGVLIDWPGTANVFDYAKNKQNSEAIIAGCQRHGLEFAIVYEDHNLGMAHDAGKLGDMIAQGKADMAYLQGHYFKNSHYIHINGAPLLLDFGPQTLKGGQWGQIFSVFSQKPVFLTLWNQMQDAGGAASGEFAWIYSNFIEGLNNFYKFRNINLKFGVAYPGFDSAYAMGGWPGPGWTIPVSVDTFTKTLDAAINGGSHYIQVATWNDYGEGTMIEPTKEFGYGFLTTLQRKLGVKHTQSDLEQVTKLFHQRKMFASNVTRMAQLDNAFNALVNLEPDVAKSILDFY